MLKWTSSGKPPCKAGGGGSRGRKPDRVQSCELAREKEGEDVELSSWLVRVSDIRDARSVPRAINDCSTLESIAD